MKEVLTDLEKGKYVRTQIIGKDNKQLKLDSINEMRMGTLIEVEDYIKFTNVPIASPNGDVFIKQVSFQVKKGVNTVVTGPNGCGKSSLFRILSGLWPLKGGILERPSIEKLFYIPQRPYLPPGTLRDQVIYPQSKQTMMKKGLTDDHIR